VYSACAINSRTGHCPTSEIYPRQSRQAIIFRLAALFASWGTFRFDCNWYCGAMIGTDHIFSFRSLDETQESTGASRRHKLIYVIYVVAIATATLGWLWLIVWCAMKFI